MTRSPGTARSRPRPVDQTGGPAPRLDFRQPADSAIGTTCTIEIADGDAYVFAAVEGAIAITLAGEKPSAPGDLFVATSSLCLK
jgi:hypothetical protein